MNPYDNHAIVEVYVKDKWQIYDPTFNVSYRSAHTHELLSAQEMNEALVMGKFHEVEPAFYGEVACPARLENYYMHYLPLYNNVFILHEEGREIWRRVLPFRYFSGSKLL